MPTRKQRRRRKKELRHEYELVWEDAEGNVLDSDDAPSNGAAKSKSAARPQARSRRQPQPPSWRRTLKRGLIFAPIMLGTVMLLSNKQTLAQQITSTALVVVIFIPFSYMLDSLFWRSQQKRAARDQAARKRG